MVNRSFLYPADKLSKAMLAEEGTSSINIRDTARPRYELPS